MPSHQNAYFVLKSPSIRPNKHSVEVAQRMCISYALPAVVCVWTAQSILVIELGFIVE